MKPVHAWAYKPILAQDGRVFQSLPRRSGDQDLGEIQLIHQIQQEVRLLVL
jgi:hypothetical protein